MYVLCNLSEHSLYVNCLGGRCNCITPIHIKCVLEQHNHTILNISVMVSSYGVKTIVSIQ